MLCLKCGKSFTSSGNYSLCGSCALSSKNKTWSTKTLEEDKSFLGYAGWGLRVIAFLTDFAIIYLFSYILVSFILAALTRKMFLFLEGNGMMDFGQSFILANYTFFILMLTTILFNTFFYKILFESSSLGATPGKFLMGLSVRGSDGSKVTFITALLRQVCRCFNVLTIGLGYIVAFFSERNQALHDRFTDTLVIKTKEISNGQILTILILSVLTIFIVSCLPDTFRQLYFSNLKNAYINEMSRVESMIKTN